MPCARTPSNGRLPLATALVIAATLAFLPLSAATAPAGRVVAIADIHGAGAEFRALLQAADLLDANGRWAGGTSTLVQTGDFTDRGRDVRAVIDLLMKIEQEARTDGGRVHVLLGNHETMNMMANVRDVSADIFGSFATPDAAERREEAFRAYGAWVDARTDELGHQPGDPQTREQWMAAHPLGFVEYMDAFGPDGSYGRWLRAKPVVAEVGDTIFLHGGLHPDSDESSVDGVNDRARKELERFDDYRQHLIDRGVILPLSTYQEIVAATVHELEAWNARLAPPQRTGSAAALTRADLAHIEILIDLQSMGDWSILREDGPLWFRGFARWSPDEGPPRIAKVLRRFGASRVVVGHSVTASRRITARFDGQVFLIDTGMLTSAYRGRPSALELADETVTAIYLGEREPLLPARRRTRAGRAPVRKH